MRPSIFVASLLYLCLAASTFAPSAVAAEATPSPEFGTPYAASATDPAAAPETDGQEDARLRIGVNVSTGAILSPGLAGGGGFAFRIGVQANRLIGFYYQVSPLLFTGFSLSREGASARAIGLFQNSLMASVTPIDRLELALGPSLDYAGLAVVSASDSEAGAEASSRFFFGAAGRVALHLGRRNTRTGRRTSFTIGLDPHVLFGAGSAVVALTAGFGVDWY